MRTIDRPASRWTALGQAAPDRTGVPATPPGEARAVGPAAPSRRELLAVFLVALATLGAGAAFVSLRLHLVPGDALSRTYSAATVLYGSHPSLANIGFIWAPLPTLLQVPLALFPPLLADGLAGALVSALAGAAGLVFLHRSVSRHVASRLVRLLVLVAYQGHLLVLFYSTNGMTEMLLIAVALAGWDQLEELWRELPTGAGARHVSGMGLCAGLAFLIRYEGAAYGAALFLALLGALFARSPRVRVLTTVDGRRRPDRAGLLAVEGHALAYLAPLTYAIFIWAFFNWLIMDDPLFFVRGRGANLQQVAVGIAGGAAYGELRGNLAAALLSALRTSGLVFPAFYLALGLLAVLATLRRDVLAGLAIGVTASFPGFQALMLFTGQSFGFARFFTYVVPFSVVGLAYAAGQLAVLRPRLRLGAEVGLALALAGASLATPWTITALAVSPDDEIELLRAVAQVARREETFDRFAPEREVARYVRELPAGARVLADDMQADAILLFSGDLRRFVTTRDADFLETVRAPVGKVSHVLVPDVAPALDRFVEAWPGAYQQGTPFLELEREFAGARRSWRLYRVRERAASRADAKAALAGRQPAFTWPFTTRA